MRIVHLIALLLLIGCTRAPGTAESSGESPSQSGTTQGPENPYGFETWHRDFPGAPSSPHLSPRKAGRWYDRTPRQAVETIVENLQGACSRDAWLFAKDVFARIEPEWLPILIERLDLNLQVPERSDAVENLVEAMGRAADPSLAEPLLRALDHRKAGVRGKVMQSLVRSGTPEAVHQAFGAFARSDTKGQNGWIRAAGAHLGKDAIGPFRAIVQDPRFAGVVHTIVKEALKMPPAEALQVFEVFGDQLPAEIGPTIAGLRHAVGDGGGTAMLLRYLQDDAPQIRTRAVTALGMGRLAELLDELMKIAIQDPDPDVRLTALQVLAKDPSDHVTDAIESMAADESLPVRQFALKHLAERGRYGPLDDLMEEVRTKTGTGLGIAMTDLVAARDGRAVAVIQQRLKQAPPGERRNYIKMIAFTTRPEAFEPLRDIFLGDEPSSRELQDYAIYMMRNVRGSELRVLELLNTLDKSEYRRRAQLIVNLANVAPDRDEPELSKAVYSAFRSILSDREEIPQMRLLALEYLRRDLRLSDMSAIKRMLVDEDEPMRKALTDFLFEFF